MSRGTDGHLEWTRFGPRFEEYQKLYSNMVLGELVTPRQYKVNISDASEEVKEMLRMDENRDVYFLYKETWDGKEISELENSHLINILLKLEREVCKNKTAFELFVLDHSSDKLLKPIYEITELAKMEPKAWLEETPIWRVLNAELKKRKLEEYYKIVSAREATKEREGE